MTVPLEPFQRFHVWAAQHGLDNPFGLDWEALRHFDPARSMKQSRASMVDPFIDVSLPPRQHLQAALALSSPFAQEILLEKDLQFAVHEAVCAGLDIMRVRNESYAAFRSLGRALLPIDNVLLAARHVHHVPGFRPALTAALVSILDWPDRGLPECLCRGFPIVGSIPPSGIFRPTSPEPLPEVALLGHDAISYVDALESDLRVHPSAAIILEESTKEQDLGLLGSFHSRAFFDNLYGIGQWRPSKRHTVHQHDKERPVDDGRTGRHNECTQLHEAIVNQRPDFPLAVVKFWYQDALQFLRSHHPAASPSDLPQHMPWLEVVAGTEDLWKGYRQNHPLKDHMCVNIITFVHPHSKKRVYAQLYGLPFGLASAVNQFNRAPQLFTAVCRRVFSMVAGHYFDDSIQFEYAHLAGAHKTLFIRILETFGVLIGHHKRQHMTSMPRFLGMVTDLSRLNDEHVVTLSSCPETKQRALRMLSAFLSSGRVTPAEAAKARGLLNWLEMSLLGKPLTAAFSGLIARQYFDHTNALTPSLALCLQYLQLALSIVPSRRVPVYPRLTEPVIVYTDASTAAPTPLGFRL